MPAHNLIAGAHVFCPADDSSYAASARPCRTSRIARNTRRFTVVSRHRRLPHLAFAWGSKARSPRESRNYVSKHLRRIQVLHVSFETQVQEVMAEVISHGHTVVIARWGLAECQSLDRRSRLRERVGIPVVTAVDPSERMVATKRRMEGGLIDSVLVAEAYERALNDGVPRGRVGTQRLGSRSVTCSARVLPCAALAAVAHRG